MTAFAGAYRALAQAFASDPRVTSPSEERGRFGSNGYRVDGKTFAMSVDGRLAVKLRKEEIDAAVRDGHGERLTMGRRVMREWLVVTCPPARWSGFVQRARRFVGGDE